MVNDELKEDAVEGQKDAVSFVTASLQTRATRTSVGIEQLFGSVRSMARAREQMMRANLDDGRSASGHHFSLWTLAVHLASHLATA